MKEKIYTIPVNDAYAAGAHCPLCALETALNDSLLDYYLGPSLMEPDIRMSTNQKGFCRRHLAELYRREDNRLGLGLMLHTHTADLVRELNPALSDSVPAAEKLSWGRRRRDFRQVLTDTAARIEERAKSCAICDRLEKTMDRYLDVICDQYVVEPAFRQRFDQGQGYCLPHVALLLRGAARYLNADQARLFVSSLARIQNQSLETLRDDIEWYTLKFDYRNQKKDWKNSKDALPRAINQICGAAGLDDCLSGKGRQHGTEPKPDA